MNLHKSAVNLKYFIKILVSILFMKRERAIAGILTKRGLSISCAESCTGGLISSRLTDVSGSSAYIMQNFVTYSNDAKMKILGVKSETLENNGAVSSQTAEEMAQGLIDKYACSIGLSITGIAGPSGAENKPAGLVFISIAGKNCRKVYKYQAPQFLCRRIMKYVFADKALDYLLQFLQENQNANPAEK